MDERDTTGVSFADIRQRAYELWERNHRPDGYEVTFWLIAERELRAERRQAEGRRSPAPSDEPAGEGSEPEGT